MKPLPYILCIMAGVGIGWLLFNCKIEDTGINELMEKAKNDSIQFKKTNDSLYYQISLLKKNDSTLNNDETGTNKKHQDLRKRGIDDVAYDSLLQSVLTRGRDRFGEGGGEPLRRVF